MRPPEPSRPRSRRPAAGRRCRARSARPALRRLGDRRGRETGSAASSASACADVGRLLASYLVELDCNPHHGAAHTRERRRIRNPGVPDVDDPRFTDPEELGCQADRPRGGLGAVIAKEDRAGCRRLLVGTWHDQERQPGVMDEPGGDAAEQRPPDPGLALCPRDHHGRPAGLRGLGKRAPRVIALGSAEWLGLKPAAFARSTPSAAIRRTASSSIWSISSRRHSGRREAGSARNGRSAGTVRQALHTTARRLSTSRLAAAIAAAALGEPS